MTARTSRCLALMNRIARPQADLKSRGSMRGRPAAVASSRSFLSTLGGLDSKLEQSIFIDSVGAPTIPDVASWNRDRDVPQDGRLAGGRKVAASLGSLLIPICRCVCWWCQSPFPGCRWWLLSTRAIPASPIANPWRSAGVSPFSSWVCWACSSFPIRLAAACPSWVSWSR
jgi:hypothetical protein